MKGSRRLYDYEAEQLGLVVKEHETGRSQASYFVDQKEWDLIASQTLK